MRRVPKSEIEDGLEASVENLISEKGGEAEDGTDEAAL
jgi:hypothetical protein